MWPKRQTLSKSKRLHHNITLTLTVIFIGVFSRWDLETQWLLCVFKNFIYLFMIYFYACAGSSLLSLRQAGPTFSCGGSSRFSGFSCCGQALGHAPFNSCSMGSSLLAHRLGAPSMWDLPRLGIEPVSPELKEQFSATGPPGSPKCDDLHW